MEKAKLFFLLFLISTASSIIIAPLRGINNGIYLCSLLGFVLYFFLCDISLKKFHSKLSPVIIFIAILSGLFLVQLPLRIIDFKNSIGTLPDFLLHLLGVLLGYASHKLSPKKKWSLFSIGLCICLFMPFKGHELWMHKINFGSFTGKTEIVPTSAFQFTDEKGEIYSMGDFAGKYVVVDFWYTGCGVCFSKFPLVQDLYEKYKDNSSVSIFSMNTRLKHESETIAFETIKTIGYSFPVYRLEPADPILTELGVDRYPTVLIFNKNGTAIYRGTIENASDLIDKLVSE